MKINEKLIGKRIRLVSMENDPNPVEEGSMGTIYHVVSCLFGKYLRRW